MVAGTFECSGSFCPTDASDSFVEPICLPFNILLFIESVECDNRISYQFMSLRRHCHDGNDKLADNIWIREACAWNHCGARGCPTLNLPTFCFPAPSTGGVGGVRCPSSTSACTAKTREENAPTLFQRCFTCRGARRLGYVTWSMSRHCQRKHVKNHVKSKTERCLLKNYYCRPIVMPRHTN